MGRDRFEAAVEEVATAGRAACEAIESAVQALEVGARASMAGVPLPDVVESLIAAGGRDVRLAAAEAFREFERAVAEMRAQVVRSLIDDERLTLTEVASRLHISRQAVGRLYRDANGGDRPAAV